MIWHVNFDASSFLHARFDSWGADTSVSHSHEGRGEPGAEPVRTGPAARHLVGHGFSRRDIRDRDGCEGAGGTREGKEPD